jgi:hypothetical protein
MAYQRRISFAWEASETSSGKSCLRGGRLHSRKTPRIRKGFFGASLALGGRYCCGVLLLWLVE